MNIKKTILSIGLIGTLAMPLACSKEVQEINNPVVAEQTVQKQVQMPAIPKKSLESTIDYDSYYFSIKGDYRIPLKVSSNEVNLESTTTQELISTSIQNSKENKWTRYRVPEIDIMGLGLKNNTDVFVREYTEDNTRLTLLVGYVQNAKDFKKKDIEEVKDFIVDRNINKDSISAKKEYKIKLDKESALKTCFKNKANNTYMTSIFTVHNNKTYILLFSSSNGKDPEGTFDKIEKKFKFTE